MSKKVEMKIASDFSAYPGPRERAMTEEPNSGEEFLEDFFIPWLKKNKDAEELVVNLDGAASYPPSFLEEAFGGAVRKGYGDQVAKITIISNDEPELKEEIRKDIENAQKALKKKR